MRASLRILQRDPKFRRLIRVHGKPDFSDRKNPFRSLVRSIVYQQVSGKAAAAILARFVGLFPGKRFPAPADVLKTPTRRLRSAGLSSQKIRYIRDLAEKFSNGTIRHRALRGMTNDEIAEHLLQVKGIGTWTVHMFLIFTLQRPDVLPTGDLGIQKGFQKLYGLKSLPDARTMERIAKPWRAHASVASWYLWRIADSAKTAAPPKAAGGKAKRVQKFW